MTTAELLVITGLGLMRGGSRAKRGPARAGVLKRYGRYRLPLFRVNCPNDGLSSLDQQEEQEVIRGHGMHGRLYEDDGVRATKHC